MRVHSRDHWFRRSLNIASLACAMFLGAAQAGLPTDVQGAAPSALSRLPDDTVQRLRQAVTPIDSAARLAVRQEIHALREELDAEAQNGQVVTALQPRGVGSHRAQFKLLRQHTLAELAALQEAVRANAGETHAAHVANLIDEARKRFDRVDTALRSVEEARDDGQARSARRALRALAKDLSPDAAVPVIPTPTRSPMPVLLREPGEDTPSRALPRYVIDTLRERDRQFAQYPPLQAGSHPTQLRRAVFNPDQGFGVYRTAAVLQPVAPETSADCSASAPDLSEDGVEVRLTPEVRALAQSLQYSPTRILKWMQQQIRFKPYWGSLKGSLGVLQTQEGNATDQSSLLIALLRASNVPARFVRGTVVLYDQQPSDNASGRAQRWLGTKNYSGSAAYLGQGVPAGAVILNGSIQGLSFDHVWVQACVPFAAYRGSSADTSGAGGYRWVPLDPTIKDHDYQAGMTVNVPLDTGSFYVPYLARRTDQLPPDYLADRTEAAARAVRSDASVEDVPYHGTPRTLRLDVLPSAPPFTVTQFSNWPGTVSPEASFIPDGHRHKFSVTVKNPAGAVLAAATLTLPQNVLSRVTLSYAPNAAGQALWNNWGGSLSALPAGSVSVYPQIKVDAALVSSGIAGPLMTLATTHSVTMKLTQGENNSGECINDDGNPGSAKDPDPTCLNKTVYGNIKAGAYYALGFNANQTNDAELDSRAAALAQGVTANTVPATPAAGGGYEATVGELLHLVLQTYIDRIDRADKRIAELRGFLSVGNYDIGLTGSDLKTDYLFDLPLVVKPAGVYIDFKGGIYGFAKIDSSADFSASRSATLKSEQLDLARLSIYSTSALEHHVWQEALRTDAVSTVRGLQFAGETGNPLIVFTPTNIGSYDSLMQMSGATSMAAFKPSIQAEVAAGAIVTVPRAQIAYTDPVDPSKAWRGAVYMSENQTSGVYGAIINGSISGGFPLLNSSAQGALYASNPNAPGSLDGSWLGWLGSASQGANALASWSGDPVNMLSGNLSYDHTDLSIKGRGGLPIVLARWYNSGSPQDGPFGFGWTHSFNQQVKLYGVEGGLAKVGWLNGSGGETYFSTANHASGDIVRGTTLVNSAGSYVQFTRVSGGADDGKYRIRERDGTVYLFASAVGPNVVPSPNSAVVARLLSITDRKGNALATNYDAGGRLGNVSDSLGRTVLTFAWTGNHITQVTDYSGRTVKYGYGDGNGNLTQVTDALNQTHSYSYYTAADGAALNHHLKRNTLPRGNGMEFEYYSGGQVFRHIPFDTAGSLITGAATSFHFNRFGRDSWSVNERGFERHHTFDNFGNPVRIVEENGAEHVYSYDPARPYNRLAETDPVGRVTHYTYNNQDLVETVTLPSGAIIELRDYNSFAMPQRSKDARGNWTWLGYDAAGNLTDRIALHSGSAAVAGTLPAAADMVAWTRIAYDTVGNPTTTTRISNFGGATGPSITFNWDPQKLNVLSVTRAGNRNGSSVKETSPLFFHDTLNRLIAGIDARWYPTAFEYDALDRVTSATDSTGKARRRLYDANNNIKGTEFVDAGTRVDSSATTYDERDRPVRVLDHAGNLSTMSYDDAGNLIGTVSPDSVGTGFDYDAANRPFAAYDAEGNRRFTQLDTAGRPLGLTDPNGNTFGYQYWGASNYDGRLKRVTQPTLPGQTAGRAVEYDYDAAGKVTHSRTIAADGSSVRQNFRFYDELGRTIRTVSAPDDNGQRLQVCSAYDTLSNPTEIWAGPTTDIASPNCSFGDPNLKKQFTATWDDFGHKLSSTDALGRVWTYGYDDHGNLASSQSPEQAKAGSANKTTCSYSTTLNGLLAGRIVPGAGSTGQTVSYLRNPLGQVTHAETRDGGGAIVVAYDFTYDTAHRLASIADSRGGKSIGYVWTPGGRLSRITLLDAGSVTHQWDFRYDAVGRLSAIVAPNGQSVSIALDAGGRLIERNFGNGLASSLSWLPDGSLASISHKAGSTVMAQSSYTYDLWGNRATASNVLSGAALPTLNYGYDALNRLKSVSNGSAAQDEGYAFDLFGNRSSKTLGTPVASTLTYQYDAAQQLNQIQQTVNSITGTLALLRYDDNGNLKKLCDAGGGTVSGTATDCTASGAGSQTTSFTWDGLDELVALAKSGTATLNEAYAYDDAGRRIRKTSGAATTHYVYNGEDIVAEWTGSAFAGAPAAVYTHGAGTDDPLMRLTGASGTPDAAAAYYAQDGIGSVVALVSVGSAANQTPLPANTLTTTGDYSSVGYPGSQLNDGITVVSGNSGWVGVVASGAASTLTFSSTITVEHVELMGVSNYLPSSYVVEVQNGSGPWTPLASGTDADFAAWSDGSSVRAVKSFTPVAATAIRVRYIGAVNSGLVWLTEWQVWSAGGSAVTQQFDAWGQLLQATGSIPTYGYTGREPDASGLVFYRARYYMPGYGRFIKRDPMGLAAGINPYAYASGNPLLFNDPNGLLASSAWNSVSGYWGEINGTTRLLGGLQAIGGLSEIGLGATVGVGAGWTGVGAVAGAGLIGLGADQTLAGLRTLISGQATPSFVNQGMQGLGLSPTQAAWGDAAINLGATFGGTGLLRGLGTVGDVAGATGNVGGSLADDLAGAASRARAAVGEGSGPVYGTRVHTAFESEVNSLGNSSLSTEVSYLNGQVVPRGTPGSVRLDVVNGPLDAPLAVYDLKTGGATLTPGRIQQIQSHIPGGASVPVILVRP